MKILDHRYFIQLKLINDLKVMVRTYEAIVNKIQIGLPDIVKHLALFCAADLNLADDFPHGDSEDSLDVIALLDVVV